MSMDATAAHSWLHFPGTLRRMLRKIPPLRARVRIEEQQLQDLERLARLSPHLLEDVGFAKDTRRSSPETTVWRNGDTLVLIQTEPVRVLALAMRAA